MKLVEYGYDEGYGDGFCDVVKDVENLEEAKEVVKSHLKENWADVDIAYNENSWNGNTYRVDADDADDWCGWLKFKLI